MLTIAFPVAALSITLAPGVPAAGTLLVSGYTVDGVFRYELPDGGFIDTLDGAGGINGPLGVARGPDGRLYVASEISDEILRFESSTGAFVDVFVAAGTGGLSEPAAVVFGPDATDDGGADLYVSSFNRDSVLLFDGADGAFVRTFVPSGRGGLEGPDAGMVFGPDGNLYVPSFWSNEVLRYDGTDGSFIDVFVPSGRGGLARRPRTIVFRSDGHMLVSSETTDGVLLYAGSDGSFMRVLVGAIDGPTGMAIDSAGWLYVASIEDSTVLRYDAMVGGTGGSGDVVVAPGAGGLALPTFVLLLEACIGDADGNGVVDFVDILVILMNWGASGGPADLDGSGTVDFGDVLVVLSGWGACA